MEVMPVSVGVRAVVSDSSRRERRREVGWEGTLSPTISSIGATFKEPEV